MAHDPDVEQVREIVRRQLLVGGRLQVLLLRHFGALLARVQGLLLARVAQLEVEEKVLVLGDVLADVLALFGAQVGVGPRLVGLRRVHRVHALYDVGDELARVQILARAPERLGGFEVGEQEHQDLVRLPCRPGA